MKLDNAFVNSEMGKLKVKKKKKNCLASPDEVIGVCQVGRAVREYRALTVKRSKSGFDLTTLDDDNGHRRMWEKGKMADSTGAQQAVDLELLS